MGAWSQHAFGNDTALDWAAGLETVDDLSLVREALDAVAGTSADIDASLACEALAAIEVLAALRGHPGPECPESVQDWVARQRLTPPGALIKQAQAALALIGGPSSELRALWREADDPHENGREASWLASLADLGQRLAAAPQPLPPPPDAAARLLSRLCSLNLTVPPYPASPADGGPLPPVARQQLYACILAAEALGDTARLRDGIVRLWPHLSGPQDLQLRWDLAVREAKTWAAEGRLDEALAGLEPWRAQAESLAPGTFAMRCMAVCQEAGARDQTEALREQLIAAGQGATLQRLDAALLQARAGSPEAAHEMLRSHAEAFSAPGLVPWRDFALGILAARAGDRAALDVLTAWLDERVTQAQAGPAVWPFLGIGGGWWALALHQAGRSDEARTALDAIHALLAPPENALLVSLLHAAGLLAATTTVRALPRPPSAAAEWPGVRANHGSFSTVSVRGVNALQQLDALRAAFAGGSRQYPLLVGDAADLDSLLDSLEPPDDGGEATLAAARALDATAWLRDHGAAKLPRWRAGNVPPNATVQALLELQSGHLKPLVHIALIEGDDPCELFARIGWGGWNGCPEPAVHVALHRHWRERFGAEPLTLSDAVLECTVARPPVDRPAALALAAEQRAYCDDIVEQGVGSTAALAATLLTAPVWYFWWD